MKGYRNYGIEWYVSELTPREWSEEIREPRAERLDGVILQRENRLSELIVIDGETPRALKGVSLFAALKAKWLESFHRHRRNKRPSAKPALRVLDRANFGQAIRADGNARGAGEGCGADAAPRREEDGGNRIESVAK